MIIIAYVLIALGALITFFSGKIAKAILVKKREPNEADVVYIKLAGFLCILVSAILILL